MILKEALQKKLDVIQKAADDKLGEDIRVIEIPQQAGICDCFVLVTGRNKNHTQAVADAIEDKLAEAGIPAENVEGFRDGGWILLDCGDVIVHVFTKDQRDYYSLESLWK